MSQLCKKHGIENQLICINKLCAEQTRFLCGSCIRDKTHEQDPNFDKNQLITQQELQVYLSKINEQYSNKRKKFQAYIKQLIEQFQKKLYSIQGYLQTIVDIQVNLDDQEILKEFQKDLAKQGNEKMLFKLDEEKLRQFILFQQYVPSYSKKYQQVADTLEFINKEIKVLSCYSQNLIQQLRENLEQHYFNMVKNGNHVAKTLQSDQQTQSAAISDNYFACSQLKNIKIYNLDGHLFQQIQGVNHVSAMVFSNDSRVLAFGDIGGVIKVYNIQSQEILYNLQQISEEVTTIRFIQINTLLASYNNKIMQYDTLKDQQNLLPLIQTERTTINVFDFNQQQGIIGIGVGDNSIRIFNLNGHLRCCQNKAHDGRINHIHFSKLQVATSGTDQIIKIWQLQQDSLQLLQQIKAKSYVQNISWGLQGQYLLTITQDEINIFSTYKADTIRSIKLQNSNCHPISYRMIQQDSMNYILAFKKGILDIILRSYFNFDGYLSIIQNIKYMNEQIKLLNNYLDATNETSVDQFDNLVNHILQYPNDQIIKYIKDQIDIIEIKQKIRLLQLIDELITSNDKYLYDAIKTIMYDKLTDYYNHQQQVTSNYLNQEDQIEIIELYIYVNKILGQFNNVENQSMISVFKTQEQIIQSRPSIVLEENIQQYNYYDDKQTQTDEDQEISQWKLKWELQVRYNQRLQKINQQLRDDKTQLYQQIEQLNKQLKSVEQDDVIINQDDEEEDDIIINDIEEVKQPPSIIKKQQNDIKKQVQFQSNKLKVQYDQELFGSIITQLSKYNSLFNYKKSCLSNQSILFDDKNITIHMQSSLTQPNYVQFVFTFINKTKSTISQFITKYTNQHIPVPEFNRISIQSKQYQRQTVNLPNQICFILISFIVENEQYRYQIPTPNFQTKFIDSIQMNMKEYRQKWDYSKHHYQRLISDYVKMNITVDELSKYFKFIIIDNNRYYSLFQQQGQEIYIKLKINDNKIQITIQSQQKMNTLMQQLLFLFQ